MKLTAIALAAILAVASAGSAVAGSCCPSKKAAAAEKAAAAPAAEKAGCGTSAKDCPSTATKTVQAPAVK